MTIVRASLGQSQQLHIDKLTEYLADKNPDAKPNFYGDDFVRFGGMYSAHWVGLFAVACYLTKHNPFFVATQTHTPEYVVKGGTMSRYAALARAISEQYKYGEHWVERTFTLGGYTIDGKEIEQIIQDIVKFSELPKEVKEQFPVDGVIRIPEPVKPVTEDTPVETKPRTPIWWRLVRRPVEYALVGVVGALLGNIPAVKEYADEIIVIVMTIAEHLLFS